MFKTELHCHSNDISLCARVSASDIVKKFSEAGYNTVVLTNHFSDYTVDHHSNGDIAAFVDKYFEAYEKLKAEAQGKFNVLIGAELRFKENCNDYLLFGITKKFFLDHPEIMTLNPERLYPILKEYGIIIVQAHPFRNGMTVVRPCFLDGVEIFNGHMGHDSRNEIAEAWAKKFNLIATSGTDFHYNDVPANAGIFTDVEITSSEQLVEILKSGNFTLNREI